jgi:hypothetical protein
VTATALGAPRRSLIGRLGSAVHAHLQARGATRAAERVARALTVLRENLMTFAALAAMDLGAFQVWHHGGWFALAVSLVLADFAATGK